MQPPPLSPALERALGELRPIRTRRPVRDLVAVVAASVGGAAALLSSLGPRHDLARVSPLFVVYGAGCLASLLALLWCALVPPKGEVLPSRSFPARATAWMLGALFGLNLALAFTGDGIPARLASAIPGAELVSGAWRCLLIAAPVVAGQIAVGAWSLRRVLRMSGRGVPVAISGAGSLLAALVLHGHCANEDWAHVAVVHGAVLLLPACLAVVLAMLLSRLNGHGRAVFLVRSRGPGSGRLSPRSDGDMSGEVRHDGR